MHSRTRHILNLIADPTTDAILDELRKGARTEKELIDRSPTDRHATRSLLDELKVLEVVSAEKAPPVAGKRGPRPYLYSATSVELFAFRDTADKFALRLLEAQAESLRRHVEKLPQGPGGPG